MTSRLAIPPDAIPYLVKQRGAISDMRADTMAWLDAYADTLQSELRSIDSYLPDDCQSILDVGGGMGGIDILLSEEFSFQPDVTLLDGIGDPPEMTVHRRHFSNFQIACGFLCANGVPRPKIHSLDPDNLPPRPPRYYDLVISFKSWCFHYPPGEYLDFIAAGCIAGETKIIVDVRREKRDEYLAALLEEWYLRATIYEGQKFQTLLFEA